VKSKKQNNGFTLVELLVVISIIALLLAILMPALGKAREQAVKVVCKSHTRQVSLGHLVYTQDYNGSFYTAPNPTESPKKTPKTYVGNAMHNYPNYWPSPNFIGTEPLTAGKYLKSVDIFYCPNYFKVFNKNSNKNIAWSVHEMGMIQFVNAFFAGDVFGTPPKNLRRMKFVYKDTSKFTVYPACAAMAKTDNCKPYEAMIQDVIMQEIKDLGTNQFKATHKDGANVIFMDGHSEYVPLRRLDSVNFRASGSWATCNWSIYPGQM